MRARHRRPDRGCPAPRRPRAGGAAPGGDDDDERGRLVVHCAREPPGRVRHAARRRCVRRVVDGVGSGGIRVGDSGLEQHERRTGPLDEPPLRGVTDPGHHGDPRHLGDPDPVRGAERVGDAVGRADQRLHRPRGGPERQPDGQPLVPVAVVGSSAVLAAVVVSAVVVLVRGRPGGDPERVGDGEPDRDDRPAPSGIPSTSTSTAPAGATPAPTCAASPAPSASATSPAAEVPTPTASPTASSGPVGPAVSVTPVAPRRVQTVALSGDRRSSTAGRGVSVAVAVASLSGALPGQQVPLPAPTATLLVATDPALTAPTPDESLLLGAEPVPAATPDAASAPATPVATEAVSWLDDLGTYGMPLLVGGALLVALTGSSGLRRRLARRGGRD
ncbi:MAG: hypothetical protein PGN11_03515 [Quadrisphaera sp.]